MSYMSLEVIRNKFSIHRINEQFILNREISESLEADDFLRMAESFDKQIEACKEELKALEEKKVEFDKWVAKATEIKADQYKRGREERQKWMNAKLNKENVIESDKIKYKENNNNNKTSK